MNEQRPTMEERERMRRVYGSPPSALNADGRNPGTDRDVMGLLAALTGTEADLTATAEKLGQVWLERDALQTRVRELEEGLRAIRDEPVEGVDTPGQGDGLGPIRWADLTKEVARALLPEGEDQDSEHLRGEGWEQH